MPHGVYVTSFDHMPKLDHMTFFDIDTENSNLGAIVCSLVIYPNVMDKFAYYCCRVYVTFYHLPYYDDLLLSIAIIRSYDLYLTFIQKIQILVPWFFCRK